MSKRNKLEKFADLLTYPHVYESFEYGNPVLTRTLGEELEMKGQWNSFQFENKNPIVLELACGRGEYSLDLARRYPQKNFIGIDIKGARIWKGARTALREKIPNVAFLRTRIEQLERFFTKGEVSEIWITFPDPFKKDGSENRRLSSSVFLHQYTQILNNGGPIHLKTDSEMLYEYSRQSVEAFPHTEITAECKDIYAGDLPHPDLDILTYYERQHLQNGLTIKYLQFSTTD